MYFGGDLGLLPPSTLFQVFNLAPLTGMLKIENERRTARFFFREGKLVFATGDCNRKRIGELLVEAGAITRAQLEEVLEIWESEGHARRVGEILVERGHLDPPIIAEALREQMRNVVYDVLTWKEGKFTFLEGHMPDQDEIFLDAEMNGLLLEGLRRFDEAVAEAALFQA